jgi:hypothetical protein
MRTILILGKLILLALICPADAGQRMPRQYQGTWCLASDGLHKRCSELKVEQDISIAPNALTTTDSSCKPEKITAGKKSLVVRFRCYPEPPTRLWPDGFPMLLDLRLVPGGLIVEDITEVEGTRSLP